MLLVASHHGGFVDPALLVAVISRPIRFLAMGTLFRNPLLRALLSFAGTLPIHRAQDPTGGAGPAGNVDTFAACFDHLRKGGAIGIFPEGEASDEPRLLPLRTGAARIAIGAHARGTMGLRIVPVGLIYERKQRARSRAYVRVGEPIAMDEDLATNPSVPADESDRAAVAALTERIEEHLADAAIDYQSAEQRSDLRLAADVALRWEHGDPRGRPPVGEVERLADRLSEAPAHMEEEVRAAARDYRDGLAVVGVPDAVVAPGAEQALARRGLFAWLLTLAILPLALVGLAANALPTLAVYAAGRRPAPPVRHATIKFLTAFVVFPLMWAVLRWWVVRRHPVRVAAHARGRADLRAGDAVVRGPAAPGAAGAVGSRAAGSGDRPRGRPPHPPRPPRRGRPSCDVGGVARPGSRTGDMNSLLR